jgi:hypothetical protein
MRADDEFRVPTVLAPTTTTVVARLDRAIQDSRDARDRNAAAYWIPRIRGG